MAVISVIVPVYNTEKYIHRCIDSILSQSFADFELILIDDGSTDASGKICENYSLKDSRVRVFHQENQGQSVARNFGLDWVFANSDSNYISFVDSDDWVHPRYLELLYDCLNRFGVNISQCKHMLTDGGETNTRVEEVCLCVSPEEGYKEYYSPYMWGKLFKRDVWRTIRFPEGQIYEDTAIWYKILFTQDQITIIDTSLYYYYINPESTVHKDWHLGRLARMEAWDAQIAFFNKRGNKELIEAAVKMYCPIAYEEYYAIEQSKSITDKEKKRSKIILKRKFRKMLFFNHIEMRNNPDYPWFFEVTYPRLYWCYWTCRGILGKIHRFFNSQ